MLAVTLNDLPIDEAVTIAGQLLRRLAIPATEHIPSQATMAASMAEKMLPIWQTYESSIPTAMGGICSRSGAGRYESASQSYCELRSSL